MFGSLYFKIEKLICKSMVIAMHILSTKSFFLLFVSAFGVSLFGNSNFSRQTIDLGMVVSDIEKSVSFYKQVVGFEEIDGEMHALIYS